MAQVLISKVAGVSFEGRQDIIETLRGNEPCHIVPEPNNQYDPNALAVYVTLGEGKVAHVGYVPRNLAARMAPHLEGEALMVKLLGVTGGFGGDPVFGLKLRIELPESEDK